ncbi:PLASMODESMATA CALLOSE-BINDING PROTEIN 2 isoform X2 [Elaeis guineensis]|uniref:PLASMODESMATA CALLOSE-BINDING PROTEIN 2 isoform X2 n=1 Tax=Elaeis guineensis var. tenera TaxID=51953 RepID=A0A6I9RCF0_ELAGV|nr:PLASMODESMATA CALLOSE-BINDING PROTEIN 2 isoform X2 [Elaeis guineensis]
MATALVMVLMVVMIGGSDAAWCVCKSDQSSTALQKTLDYACGAGADCNPIQPKGACYNPNTVVAHCSYAVNSYYQRKGQAQHACDFSGAATLTTTDPSTSGCTYPASNGTGTTSGTTPSTFSPPSSTGTGGVLGGGIGPSGNSISTEGSDAGLPSKAWMGSLLLTITFSGMVLWMS